MHNETFPVNQQEKRETVIRIVHNRENPFVQLNKKALWDYNLSLKAVGLWSRCMSRPDDWRFSIAELVKKCKEGRRAVDSAMDELIQANYVCRLEYSERGADGRYKNSGVEYVFFEFPATEEEKQIQLEKFKKSFQDCGFGDCRNGDCRNAHLLIKSTKEKEKNTKKDIPPTPKGDAPAEAAGSDGSVDESPKKKSEFSEEVISLTDKIITVLKKNNEFYRPPKNLTPSLTAVHDLLKGGSLEPSRVIEVLEYAVCDTEAKGEFPGWSVVVYAKNPIIKFCDKVGTISQSMKSRAKRSFCPSSDDAKARKCAEEMMENAL